MAYKGTDLNLRSTQGWSPREVSGGEDNGVNGGWSHGARSAEPIQVDENVVACCNAAYDAAQFHGAAEVRLEHLLHAMTRMKSATEMLEQLGVRTAQLRHDTAVAIASEAPNDEKGAPRAAGELEDVLRRAAAAGAERRALASVADVLRALLGRTKAPATVLLLRAAADAGMLERWRDAQREMPHSVVTGTDTEVRSGARPNLADALFRRLDSVEAALRMLQAEVAAERRSVADALAVRPDPGLSVGPAQLQAMSRTLEDRLSAAVTALGERLAVDDDRQPASESLAYMGARLDVIEKQVGRHSKDVVEAVSNVVLEHLVKAEGDKPGDSESTLGGAKRLAALETSIDTHLQRADEAAKTHEHSLAEIYEALVKLGTNQQTLASNLNTWRVESSGDASIISNRLEAMERTAQQTFGRLDGQVQSLRTAASGSSEDRGWHSFKRWLYGTTSVLSGGRRADPDGMHRRMRSPSTPASQSLRGPKTAPVVAAADEEESRVEIKTQA